MIKKGQDCLCISLSENTFKAAQVKGTGSAAKATHIVAADVKGLTDPELVKVIHKSLSGFNTKSSNLLFVVPSSITTTKNIEIPSTSPDEIKSIVSLQAGRHTPFSREEIQIGYINLGVYKSNYTKVLLVIVNKSVLKNQLSTLEKAGLKIKHVQFAPEGIAGMYAAALGPSTAPVGIIDIGKNVTNFIVVHQGKAITSRSIPVGKSNLAAEGAGARDKLVEELGKTIESYQSEDIEQPPSQYLLSGDDSHAKDLQPSLADKFKWNVQLTPYLSSIKASNDVLKKAQANYADVSFLDVIAAGATISEAQINLLPEEVVLQKTIEDQGREVFVASILGLLILVFVSVGLVAKLYFKDGYLKRLKKEYSQQREEVNLLERQSMRTRLLQNYLENRMVSLDTLNELYETIPNEIYLTNILMDEQGQITIEGVSDIRSLIFNLGTTLKNSELFKSVDIKSTKDKKDRGKDVSAFEISLRIGDAIDEESNLEETSQKEE
ncbi:MAG: pilus assembly protein PilM [Candidatus Omnitrophica bacterium]|nr:pilus assembly protein PilM [Candidatus Omnitrophota bacterium]